MKFSPTVLSPSSSSQPAFTNSRRYSYSATCCSSVFKARRNRDSLAISQLGSSRPWNPPWQPSLGKRMHAVGRRPILGTGERAKSMALEKGEDVMIRDLLEMTSWVRQSWPSALLVRVETSRQHWANWRVGGNTLAAGRDVRLVMDVVTPRGNLCWASASRWPWLDGLHKLIARIYRPVRTPWPPALLSGRCIAIVYDRAITGLCSCS